MSQNTESRPISRGPAWTVEEDKQLCRSWLVISQDARIGTNQRWSDLWTNIHDHFYTALGDSVQERTWNSLSSRWSTIQAKVSKFCGAMAKVERTNQSGSNKYVT
jgi:hypothetical protein